MVKVSNNDNVVISVRDVHKEFKLPHEQHSGIKQLILNLFRRNKVKGYENQHVLKGVSFDVKRGEFFGIVGRNGSGKSTLLKLLAGIYTPNKGAVHINGSLTPFIELGVGFNPELTGRENVFLNGALLGFSRDEMASMYDDIVSFAELEQFMDQKLKNYSSGMQVRLAFSIAIRAKSDILVLDEVLAVGDEAFQRKCSKFFEQIKEDDTKTVILVTHSMSDVTKYCDRAVLIKDGDIVVEGSPEVVANEYSLENINNSNKEAGSRKSNDKQATISAKLLSAPIIKNTDALEVEIKYQNLSGTPVYPKLIINYNSVPVMASNGKVHYDIVTKDTKEHTVTYTLPLESFNKGEFGIVALLVDSDKEINLADFGYKENLSIIIENPVTKDKVGGAMLNKGVMELEK